jgi:hypothetical protein
MPLIVILQIRYFDTTNSIIINILFIDPRFSDSYLLVLEYHFQTSS